MPASSPPLINGFPVARRAWRLCAAVVDYGPLVLLVAGEVNGLLRLVLFGCIVANCVWWQGKSGQTIGKRLFSLSIMRPTPAGFEVPGRIRMAIKTALIFFSMAVVAYGSGASLGGSVPFAATLTPAVLVIVLYLALGVLWLTDPGHRTMFDRVLGLDVMGVRALRPFP